MVETSPTAATLALRLDCNDHAPGVAREAVRSIDGIGWILGDAMLVTSELVTNAVVHSGWEAGDCVQVTVSVHDDCLAISVIDPGRLGGSAVSPPAPSAFGGMGLRVVEELSRAWGAGSQKDGYRVWAEVARPTPASELRSPGSPSAASHSTHA